MNIGTLEPAKSVVIIKVPKSVWILKGSLRIFIECLDYEGALIFGCPNCNNVTIISINYNCT